MNFISIHLPMIAFFNIHIFIEIVRKENESHTEYTNQMDVLTDRTSKELLSSK